MLSCVHFGLWLLIALVWDKHQPPYKPNQVFGCSSKRRRLLLKTIDSDLLDRFLTLLQLATIPHTQKKNFSPAVTPKKTNSPRPLSPPPSPMPPQPLRILTPRPLRTLTPRRAAHISPLSRGQMSIMASARRSLAE